MRIIKCGVLVLTFVLLFGCSNVSENKITNTSSNMSEDGFVQIKQDEYKRMSDIVQQWEHKQKNWANDKNFEWVRTEKWDKIEILGSNDVKYTIEDERLLTPKDTGYFGFFSLINESEIDPGGYSGDLGISYTYTFYKNGNSYILQVSEPGYILYNDKYFCVNKYIQNLGKAFIPPQKYIEVNSLLHKIAESGVIVGKYQHTTPIFQTFRALGLAYYIESGMENEEIINIENKPATPGTCIEELTLYCYGEKIIMNVYNHYIEIIDKSGSHWYNVKPENTIMSILSAG